MQTVRVARIEDFADPGKKVIQIGDELYGVFRLGQEFYGWKNRCPHQGGPVCQGRLFQRVREVVDGERKSHGRAYDDELVNIVCPWHGMEFDIRTGKFPGNPDMALEGVQVQVQDGDVFVIA